MKLIHKKRADIATYLEEYYLKERDDVRISQGRTLNNMSLDEKLGRWEVDSATDDPNSSTPQPAPDAPFLDSELQSDNDDEDQSAQLPTYRKIIANSAAFRWLLYRMQRETSFTSSEDPCTILLADAELRT